MDFTIKRSEILAAIDKCSVAAPGGHQNSAFDMMLVEAKGQKKARFAAVGERAAVDTVGEAKVKTPGSFNVRPKHLRDIASAMPDGEVRFSLKGTRVTVQSLSSKRKASFESSVVDIFHIDDPGKEAAWIEVDAPELVRALKLVKPMSTWEDRDDPVISLLVPTERGLNVFGSNGYQIALVETNIRTEGVGTIQLPSQAVDVLMQMVSMDDRVRIFADERRVYLENCDTLVSAALPASYPFLVTHQNLIAFLSGDSDGMARFPGPTFDPGLLLSGVKSVLSLGGFASTEERKKGMWIRTHFGLDSVEIELALGVADARDEFPVTESGGEIDVHVDSSYLLKVFGVLGGVPVVKAYLTHDEMVLVFQAKGLVFGIMTKVKT